MLDKKTRDKIYYYIRKMDKLKGNTSRLLNTYNLYNYLILNYDNINYLEFKKTCYNRMLILLDDIEKIKINYFYKKKIINKLLEFKTLYENNNRLK
tara:strand:- start:679 stop:966 length:288 start_codon:yes stop_codon:yes gene_type:complete